MTESDLLQLRDDVLEVVQILSKPMPQHHIRDCLVGTASAAHTKLALRMIDALVDTGEIVRHIATDGGRNTYSFGTPNVAGSRKRLRVLFEHDLDVSTMPVPMPAADASTSAAPQTLPPLPRPAPAGPPSGQNVTRINRNAKPEPYRPTDPLRARILGLVDEARQCSRAYLISRLWDVTKNNVDNHLWTLTKNGLLKRVGEGEYSRPEGVTAASAGTSVSPKAAPRPAGRAAVKESLTAGPVAAAPAPAAAEAAPTPPVTPAEAAEPGKAGKSGRPRKAKAKTAVATAEGSSAVQQTPPAATLPPVDYEGPVIGFSGARYYLKDVVVSHSPAAIAPGKAFTVGSTASAPNLPHCARRVAVLRRLAPMLAPDIGEELHAIADYIQQAGMAA